MDGIVKPILELVCCCLGLGQELGSRVDLDQNVSTLTRGMAELRSRKEQVQERVDLAEGRLHQERAPEVALWLERVDNLEREVAEIEGELGAGKEPLPLWGHAPGRWWAGVQLSGRVAAKLRELQYLQTHGEFKGVASPVDRRVHK